MQCSFQLLFAAPVQVQGRKKPGKKRIKVALIRPRIPPAPRKREPPAPLPAKKNSAAPSVMADGCPADQPGQQWTHLLSNDNSVPIKAGKTKVRRAAAGKKGWCIAVPPQGVKIDIEGIEKNYAPCWFQIKKTQTRTLRVYLKEVGDVDSGSYCLKP